MKPTEKSKIIIKDLISFFDDLAPFSIGYKNDNVGLIVGSDDWKLSKVLIALDATKAVVSQAIEENYDVVICHHPVIFHPIKTLEPNNPAVRLVINSIGMIALHTNFDCADYGTTDIMVDLMGLKSVGILNIEFPEVNKGYGRICEMSQAISPLALAEKAKSAFHCQKVRLLSGTKQIRKIALASGGSGGEIKNAIKHRCDAFIGGDIKHDEWIDAYNAGITVIDAGHFPTENIFCEHIKNVMQKAFPSLKVDISSDSVEPFIYV